MAHLVVVDDQALLLDFLHLLQRGFAVALKLQLSLIEFVRHVHVKTTLSRVVIVGNDLMRPDALD